MGLEHRQFIYENNILKNQNYILKQQDEIDFQNI